MDTCVHSYLSHIFLEWEDFKVAEKITTHSLYSLSCFRRVSVAESDY